MEGKSSVIEIRIIPEVLPSSDDQAMSHQLSVRCPQDRVGRWWQKVVNHWFLPVKTGWQKNVGGKKWQKIKSTLSSKAFLFFCKTNPDM